MRQVQKNIHLLFNLDLNVKSKIVHFILGGRVFHSPAVLLQKIFLSSPVCVSNLYYTFCSCLDHIHVYM